MLERLPPIGFWSYPRQDDDASQGQLSALRLQVRAELQQQYGHDPITIFQDVAAIPPGAEWEREIRNAISNSTFFIPIVTPAFIESRWCSTEVELFLEREQQIWADFPELAGRRRVFPIYYRSIDDVQPFKPEALEALQKLQWTDYRELRFKTSHEEVVQRALEALGRSMSSLLHIRVELPEKPISPTDPTPPVQAPPVTATRPPVAAAEPKPPPGPARGAAIPAKDPPLQGAGAQAQPGQVAQASKPFVLDTGGASAGAVVWSVARQLIAVGLVIGAIFVGLHIPSQISSGGPQSATGLFAFIVAMLGGAGVLWRAGR